MTRTEWLLFSGCFLATLAASLAAFASSRTLMARLAPKGMEGEFFGLYALSGAATVWMGSLLVQVFTTAFKSQQIGLASTGILLSAGLIIMVFVKQPPRLASGTY